MSAARFISATEASMSQKGSIIMGIRRTGSAEQNSVSQSLYAATHSVARAGSISVRKIWLLNPRMFG